MTTLPLPHLRRHLGWLGSLRTAFLLSKSEQLLGSFNQVPNKLGVFRQLSLAQRPRGSKLKGHET